MKHMQKVLEEDLSGESEYTHIKYPCTGYIHTVLTHWIYKHSTCVTLFVSSM